MGFEGRSKIKQLVKEEYMNKFINNFINFLVGLLLIICIFVIVTNFWKIILTIIAGISIALICVSLGSLIIKELKSIFKWPKHNL